MRIEQDTKLDFDDVLLLPQRSEHASRKDVAVKRHFKFKYSPIELNCVPIIAANMDCTGTLAMAESLAKLECLTALHKFYSNKEINSILVKYPRNIFYTLGIRQQDKEKFTQYINEYNAPDLICLDVPNGYIQTFVEYCRWVRSLCPLSVIMAGNVCTETMTSELVISGGIDIVKIGIGPGRTCQTRMVTGIGVPQISAIDSCGEKVRGLHAHICSDGGMKTPGDVCKGLAAGADFVMLGSMLAGSEESDGEWTLDYSFKGYEDTNPAVRKKSLKIHGMSSNKAMEKHYGKIDDYKTSEGREIEVPYKGPVQNVIKEILGGVRSCCAYIGSASIFEMSKCATFIRTNRVH